MLSLDALVPRGPLLTVSPEHGLVWRRVASMGGTIRIIFGIERMFQLTNHFLEIQTLIAKLNLLLREQAFDDVGNELSLASDGRHP